MDEEIDDFGESDDDGAISKAINRNFKHYIKSTLVQIGSTPIGASDAPTPPVSKLPAVDRDTWRDEVERLTPQLKLVLRSDQTNWRQRIDQLKTSAEKIGK